MNDSEDLAFPVKVNVGYALTPALTQYAISQSARIYDAYGGIRFQPNGPAIPHITMLMGYVSGAKELNDIVSAIDVEASSFSATHYTVTSPYYSDVSRRYVFVGLDPSRSIESQRHKLYERVRTRLSVSEHGGPDAPCHITLGFVENGGPDSLLAMLQERHLSVSGSTAVLQLALAGPQGTCLNILHSMRVGL